MESGAILGTATVPDSASLHPGYMSTPR